MFTNFYRVVTIVSTTIIVGLLLIGCSISTPTTEVTAPVEEAAVPTVPDVADTGDFVGTGPDFAMMPSTEWREVNPGEYQWYAFSYDFDEDFEPVEIRMYSEPKDGAILTIRSAEQAEKWRVDGVHEHIGCCVVQDLGDNNDDDAETKYAVWSGELFSSGTYYIVVEHAENVADPVAYRFEFAKAEGVAMPAELYADVAVAPPSESAPEIEVSEQALEVDVTESGPDFAMMPTDSWMALEDGQYHWFAFDYDFDQDYDDIEIRMFTEPEGSAILTIRNEGQAEKWRVDGEHEHIGCCVVQDLGDDSDDDAETKYAVWLGKLDSSGRYYIVVEHAEGMADTANYRFEFAASEGVSFPEGLIDPQEATGQAMPAPVVEAEPDAASEAQPVLGLNASGPDFALSPTSEWRELGEGAYHWFAFDYDYDKDFDPFEIRMYTEPEDGAILTIRNMEQAEKWREDGTHEHIGCCTVQDLGDDEETDYALWAGTLDSSGTYYIVVERAENVSGPVNYMFTIEGEGVLR